MAFPTGSAAICSSSSRGKPIGAVFVVSGPSGAGKGTVIGLAVRSLDNLAMSVSATTRSPRPGEIDGVHYHFMSRAAFERAVGNGRFLEWVEYSGNLYGTLRREVHDKLARGLDVILELELQGARAIDAALPEAVTIFVAPPSLAELRARLRGRGTEADDTIAARLRIAETEVAAASEFDFVVVNDEAEKAAARLATIITDTRKGE